jgi:hypothetical protein
MRTVPKEAAVTRHSLPSLAAVGLAAVGLAVVAVACGGGNPTSATGTGGVIVKGQVLGAGAAMGVTASANAPVAAGDTKITVTIAGTNLSTTVSANGTFEIDGVTGGTFTLVFTSNGVEIGRVEITTTASAEVKITVTVTGSTVVVTEIVVEDKGDGTGTSTAACFVAGGKVGQGIELEGRVASGSAQAFGLEVNGERSGVVDVSASSAAYKCNGGGKNALGDSECKATLTTGAKVHVRGTLMTCTATTATATASEVKLQ